MPGGAPILAPGTQLPHYDPIAFNGGSHGCINFPEEDAVDLQLDAGRHSRHRLLNIWSAAIPVVRLSARRWRFSADVYSVSRAAAGVAAPFAAADDALAPCSLWMRRSISWRIERMSGNER